MITGSASQPFTALCFLAGGALSYFLYEVLRVVRMKKALVVLAHIIDGIYALSVFVIFVALSHLLFSGKIKYFTILCYFVGMLTCRLALKPPIRRLLSLLERSYKRLVARHTRDKEEVK